MNPLTGEVVESQSFDQTYFANFVFGGTGGLLPGLSESVSFINSVSVFEY